MIALKLCHIYFNTKINPSYFDRRLNMFVWLQLPCDVRLEAVSAHDRIWAWKSIGPVQSGEYPLSVNGIKTRVHRGITIAYCRTRACRCRPPAATVEAACGRRTTQSRASAPRASRGRGARWPAIPAPPWPAPSTLPAPSTSPALRSAPALQAIQVGFNENIFRFDWISIPNEFSIFPKV